MELIKKTMNVQFGEAFTADFEENTYTFLMKGNFTVCAGEYAILPREQYEQLISKNLEKDEN